MKVYVATSGEYSDFRICRVFARREDAENYRIADDVQEWEVEEHPVAIGTHYTLWWDPHRPDTESQDGFHANPWIFTDLGELPAMRTVEHLWPTQPLPGGGGWSSAGLSTPGICVS